MRHSFGSALLLTFLLGAIFERIVLSGAHPSVSVEVYFVVVAAMALLALLYVLYRRYSGLHALLAKNHLDYLAVNLDGLSLCESLAKRCDILRHQRNQLNDEVIGCQVQLQEVNELSRILLDRLPNSSILVNQKGQVLGISQSTQRLTGYPFNDVFGMSLEKLKLLDELTTLFHKGWSQQIATQVKDLAAFREGQLRARGGKLIQCSWNMVELNLPVHRYYLITFSTEVTTDTKN